MISIYPYKLASASARALRNGLSSSLNQRVKLIRPNGNFRRKTSSFIINWGNNTIPNWYFGPGILLNYPEKVQTATNKLLAFQKFKEHEVNTPIWTTNREEAQEWCQQGDTIVIRHLLTGNSGNGIEIVESGIIPEAPLYVKYKKKRAEFRTHVFRGEVIDTQQKKKRSNHDSTTPPDPRIRNIDCGWVFCRNGIAPNSDRDALAIKAVQALDLDFGAVDIIYNERENKFYVLEVNTAPGIEGSTINSYVQAILGLHP